MKDSTPKGKKAERQHASQTPYGSHYANGISLGAGAYFRYDGPGDSRSEDPDDDDAVYGLENLNGITDDPDEHRSLENLNGFSHTD